MTIQDDFMALEFALANLRNVIYFGFGIDLMLERLDRALASVLRWEP